MKNVLSTVICLLFINPLFAKMDGYRLFGKVIGTQDCAKGMAVIWLSRNKLLIQQLELPVGGQYEFYLKGEEIKNYEIKATQWGGCESEKLNITLDPSSKAYYYELKLRAKGKS